MDKQTIPITKEHHSRLMFVDYNIINIDFKINSKFKFEKPIEVEFSMETEISFSNDKSASVTLNCIIFDDSEKRNLPFTLKITITGNFKIEGEIDNEGFMKFCELNGTTVLFPYLRTAVTNITATANQPPLVLPLINVHSLNKTTTSNITK